MNNLTNNIKKVIVLYLILFLAIISGMIFFWIVEATDYRESSYNKRVWIERESVIRGNIYDRNNEILASTDEDGNRYYPYGLSFSHIIGYYRVNESIAGIEKEYDKYLRGDATFSIDEFLDNTSQLFQEKGNNPTKDNGYNLVTTLDANIQQKAFSELVNKGKKGAVVAIKPSTGEILACTSYPSFEPIAESSVWKEYNSDSNNPLFNRAISGLYPPGSTFKTVTLFSALQNIEGVDQRVFVDDGGNEFVSNHDGKVMGQINLSQALSQSSNDVFGELGIELGNGNLKNTAEQLLFNKELNIDGISVQKSNFPTLNSSEKGDIVQSAIGQGQVLASPFHMAVITSIIANDGIYEKPYIVNRITNNNGYAIEEKKPSGNMNRIISQEDAQIIQTYMKEVVESGTGVNAKIQGIEVCGKTGTAEHGDKTEEEHSWFIAFAPAENPQIAVAVIVEEGGAGGYKAAKIAKAVIEEALLK